MWSNILQRWNKLSAFTFYQILRYASLLFISVLLTKVGLSKNQIGYYESFFLLSGVSSFFWIGGVMNALVSFTAGSSRDKIKQYFFNAFVVIVGLNLLTNLTLLFLFPIFTKLSIMMDAQRMILLVIFNLFNHTAYLVEHYYLITKRSKTLIAFSVLSVGLTVGLSSLTLLTNASIDYLLFALILAAIFRFIWLLAILIRNNCYVLNFPFLKPFIWQSALLALSILLGSVADYFDEMLVNLKYSKQWFAIFKYGAKEFPLLLLISNALNTVFIREISEDQAAGLTTIKRFSKRFMWVLYPIIILVLLTSPKWYPIVFDPPATGRITHAFPAICFKRFGTEPIPGLFRTFRSLYTRRPQFAFAAFMGLKWTSNRNRYCIYHR
jgi:O-antigen/teichoic acid export membrane protein